MKFDIEGDLILNTNKAENSLENLNNSFVSPSPNMQPLSSMGKGSNADLIRQQNLFTNLNQQLTSMNEQISKVIENFKVLSKSLEDTNNNTGSTVLSGGNGFNGFMGSLFNPFFHKNMSENQVINGRTGNNIASFNTALGIASSIDQGNIAYQRSMVNGDYMGASAGAWQAGGNVASSIGGTMLSVGAMTGNLGIMAGGALLSVGGLVANGVSSRKSLAKEEAELAMQTDSDYQNILNNYGENTPEITEINGDKIYTKTEDGNFTTQTKYNKTQGLNTRYYNAVGEDITNTVNSEMAHQMVAQILRENEHSGLDYDTMMQLLSQQASNNVEFNDLSNTIGQIGKYTRNTGADVDTVSSLAGLMTRYTKNKAEDLSYLYKASEASGLNNAQTGEFFNGIIQAMENGINKGFVKSADDIAEGMTTIALIGKGTENEEIWKSQSGSLYNQFSNSMGNATNLADTGQMIMYQAAKSVLGPETNYWDVMAYLEKGDFSNDYKEKLNELNNLYTNGDKGSNIELIRKQLGLDYTQAIDYVNSGSYDVNKIISKQTDVSGNSTLGVVDQGIKTSSKLQSTEEGIIKMSNEIYEKNPLAQGPMAQTRDSNGNEYRVNAAEVENMPTSTMSVNDQETLYDILRGDKEYQILPYPALREIAATHDTKDGVKPVEALDYFKSKWNTDFTSADLSSATDIEFTNESISYLRQILTWLQSLPTEYYKGKGSEALNIIIENAGGDTFLANASN